MIKLKKENYDSVYSMYQSTEFFFPLIAAVLLDTQEGSVYVDDANSPNQAYVEHAFGFAQIFGNADEKFEYELERYLLVDKLFSPNKIRLYAPYCPRFIDSDEHQSMQSYRQRFHIDAETFSASLNSDDEIAKDISFGTVDAANISLIDTKFGVVGRFWRTSDDFILKSNATIVSYQGEPASICYSAAEADHRVEIDVLTLAECRNLGLGRRAVAEFVRRCFALSLQPLWDCFTNNAGSMMLCKAVGFTPTNGPYRFFTINKVSPEAST